MFVLSRELDLMIKAANQYILKIDAQVKFQVIIVKFVDDEYEKFCLLPGEFITGEKLINKLKKKRNIQIESLVCMWHNGCLDVPSQTIRVKLCELNENNKNAIILLRGKEEYTTKTIEDTLN